ncbi:hypothetical protein BCR33DRAFT_194186 [Rhizoclosmatium globosum]|uniref:NAD(P)-binding protein n=1 Tax=Rhizoclosmatium globosum TaxID=329046 RepID=A0A1Y2CDP6_9FUNG|nr:hypothetical protein BCR33DRAFT_194186 [Rhizoclosmatium globosum]|eukprot:ORY45152.1 hypothetical protein BCR33DRAFT_194186 [Rhizoclosmatium globosum]
MLDGYETHFATNHLGHFQFVKEILPVLLKAQEKPRVVVVSSSATWNAPTCGIDFKSVVQKQPGFRTTNYYGQSKLANSLFAVGLNTRYGDQLIVNAVHPGVVDTDLFQITPYSPRGLSHDLFHFALFWLLFWVVKS